MEFDLTNEAFNNVEEMKRFAKALGKCRTCGHVRMAHPIKLKQNICLDATLTNKSGYKQCPCKLFVPKDNLEFLEWAAENKEKKKKHE